MRKRIVWVVKKFCMTSKPGEVKDDQISAAPAARKFYVITSTEKKSYFFLVFFHFIVKWTSSTKDLKVQFCP